MQNIESVIEAATKRILEIEGNAPLIRPEIYPWGISLARIQCAWTDRSYSGTAKPEPESRVADKTVEPLMGGSLVCWVNSIGD